MKGGKIMVLEKLIQVKVSEQLYQELIKEAIQTGLTLSQICRLRLADKKIIDRDQKGQHEKFRPVHPVETSREFQ